MLFPLASAITRGYSRRIFIAARAAPLVALMALVGLPGILGSAWFLGERLGRNLGPSFAGDQFALSLTCSLGFAAFAVGVLAGAAMPRLRHLDEQILVVPRSPRRLVVEVTLLPILPAIAYASVVGALALIGFSSHTPGGTGGGIALFAASCAAFVAGAATTEVAACLVLRDKRAVLAVMFMASWLVSGALEPRHVLAGPLLLAARTAQGMGTPALLLAVALPAVVVPAAWLWVGLSAAHIHGAPTRAPSVRFALDRSPLSAQSWAVMLMLGRRPDLRRNALAVFAGAPVLGLCLQQFTPLPELAVFFAGLLTVLGSVIIPLSARSLVLEGRWLLQAVPQPARQVCAAVYATALGLQLALVGATIGPLLLIGLPLRAAVSILVAATLCGSAALISGAVISWSETEVGEQVASFAVFVVVVAAAYGAYLGVARRLQALDLPVALVLTVGSVATLVAAVVGAVALTMRRDLTPR